jgi:hypothetical protein
MRGSHEMHAQFEAAPHPNPLPMEEWGEGIRAALAADARHTTKDR